MTRKLTPAQLDEIEAATIRKQVVHAAVNGEPDKRFATVLALIAEVRELRAKVERVRGIIGPRELLDPHQGGCEGLADETLLSILDALEEEA